MRNNQIKKIKRHQRTNWPVPGHEHSWRGSCQMSSNRHSPVLLPLLYLHFNTVILLTILPVISPIRETNWTLVTAPKLVIVQSFGYGRNKKISFGILSVMAETTVGSMPMQTPITWWFIYSQKPQSSECWCSQVFGVLSHRLRQAVDVRSHSRTL